MERRANVEGWFIPVAAGHPRAGQRGGGRLGRGGQGLELGLDGGVARGELRLTQVKEFEILLQDEDVLVAVVAGQGGGDLVDRGFAVRVTVLGEDVRVAFAGDEGAEDREPGLADDVADHARQEEVHLDQSLLHPLDVGTGVLDERIPMAQHGAEGEDRGGGPKAAAQQADTVELAQPLTVLDIALATRDVLDVAGVDEQDLQPARLEDVVDRDPVDPGGFHRDTGDATGEEPVGQALEVGREGPEGLDRGGVPIGWDGDEMFGRATVDAGDIDLDALKDRRRGAGRAWGTAAAMVLHRRLLHTGTASENREALRRAFS